MITINVNEAAIKRAVNGIEKQVRFAAAQALTKTAQDAQQTIRLQLPKRFTIRTPWLAKGVRVRPANRSTMQSAVLDMDDFMALQETGGKRESESGQATGIPFGARPKHSAVTRPGKYPGALMQKVGYFIAPLSTRIGGSARVGVWQRYGRRMIMTKGKYVGRKRQQIRLMYALAHHVTLKPRFDFSTSAERVARQMFQERFNAAFAQAMATAR